MLAFRLPRYYFEGLMDKSNSFTVPSGSLFVSVVFNLLVNKTDLWIQLFMLLDQKYLSVYAVICINVSCALKWYSGRLFTGNLE